MNVFTPAIATDEKAQKNVRAWIRALRSGKYQQGEGYLRSTAGYCCLGVACGLLEPAEWLKAEWLKEGTVFSHRLGVDEMLGPRARRWLRLSVPGQGVLVRMNDGDQDHDPPLGANGFDTIAKRLAHDMRERLETA